MTAPLLSVEGLDVFYGSVQAVRDVHLSVAAGELVSVVGANGAGKTTLLNAISGLLRPRRGSVRFAGAEIKGRRPSDIVRRGVVHVPEGRQILAQMTVLENLELGGYQRRDRAALRREIGEMLQRFPVLGQRREAPAGTLSGGEQQMLALARGLLAQPKLLLLDEPSMGLAPRVVATLFDLLRQIHAEGRTVLLVEQNAFRALQICDRAYVMETGSIVLEGNGAALMRDPRVVDAYLGGSGAMGGARSDETGDTGPGVPG